MRSITARVTLIAALSALTPAFIHAAPPAAAAGAGAGGGTTTTLPVTRSANSKQTAADARAAWKAASAHAAIAPQVSIDPFSLHVVNGEMTIDGKLAKEAMNYATDKATYLSFYLPGQGTIVVSSVATPGAIAVKDAFRKNNLMVTVAGHSLKLIADAPLLDKVSSDAYVRFDTSAAAAHQGDFSLMGYGVLTQGPYSNNGSTVAYMATR